MPNNKKIEFSDTNAQILADLIVDPQTTEQLRVKIIKEILSSRDGQGYFKTVFEEGLSFGECPCCGHMNHWGIPEDDLVQMGWVTSEKDPEVISGEVTAADCPEWQQACKKKKVVL